MWSSICVECCLIDVCSSQMAYLLPSPFTVPTPLAPSLLPQLSPPLSALPLQDAMSVLQFTPDEQMQLFRTVAAVLHFGNIEIKQRPREEQAEMQNTQGRPTPSTPL